MGVGGTWPKAALRKGVGLFYDEGDPEGTDDEADDDTGESMFAALDVPPPIRAEQQEGSQIPDMSDTGAVLGGEAEAPAEEGGGFAGFGGLGGGNLKERAARMQALGSQTGPVDPWGAAARVVNAWGGAYLAGKAEKQEAEAVARKQKAFKDAIAGKKDPDEIFQSFIDSGDPALVQQGLEGKMRLLLKPGTKAKAWEQFDANGDGSPDFLRETNSGELKPMPLTMADRFALRAAGRSSSSTTVNLPPGESEYMKESGREAAKSDAESRDAAKKARFQLDNLNQMNAAIQTLEKSGGRTGYGSQAWADASSLASSLGVKLEKSEALNARQIMASIQNRLTLQMRDTSSGQGMPGAMSDADRAFLARIPPGVDKTAGYNKFMTTVMSKQAQRTIDLQRMRSKWVQDRLKSGQPILTGDWDEVVDQYTAQNPIGTQADLEALMKPAAPRPTVPGARPAAPAARPATPQFTDGQTYKDPKTGLTYRRVRGKWVR